MMNFKISYSWRCAWVGLALCIFCRLAIAEGAQENLTRVSEPTSFTLAVVYSSTTPNGKVAFGAKPGVYVADQENSAGIFFRRAGASVVFQFGDRFRAYPGGIWVPKVAGPKPQLYIYGKSPPIEYSSLSSALEDMHVSLPVTESSRTPIDSTGLVVQTIVNQPTRISPGAAGVAGAIVGGLLAYADSQEKSDTPFLMPRAEIDDEALLRVFNAQKQRPER